MENLYKSKAKHFRASIALGEKRIMIIIIKKAITRNTRIYYIIFLEV